MKLSLKNPHSIEAVLEKRPSDVLEVKQDHSLALVLPKKEVSLEELFKTDKKHHGVWLGLDCVQDPRNVGAIFRTAAFFGVKGILLTEERSSPLTEVAYDTASGGIEHVTFSIEKNLARSLKFAKEAGLWVLGTSEHEGEAVFSLQQDRNWLILFGNEEKGLRRLTLESCDVLSKIPPQHKIQSLNVSVAVGIYLGLFAKYN
ncbi:MAG: RNA methyltransferase [Bdellovibrio sp.]|nr:RNA methyltransferase [Bdellovibrio sp.]